MNKNKRAEILKYSQKNGCFFIFKSESELYKTFSLMNSLGFVWNDGTNLMDNFFLNVVFKKGAFVINSEEKIEYQTPEYYREKGYNKSVNCFNILADF